MDDQKFIKQLNEVQDLMQQEKYQEAVILIKKLKEFEKKNNYDYNLTHRLYQLDSNAHSLYNQQVILHIINDLSNRYDSISFQELNRVLKEKKELNLSNDILQREIEILILRSLISCKIDGEKLIF
ncbi:MAG: hypothetical protein KAW03_06565 [Candidatus Lokiarchaeota archaeon]|nr:hypothetical protein [Candidatus Lokiarchaeota archaeon]